MNKVLILMSTYNGEEYLREQLDSIVKNLNENIKIDLIVRDDGSHDNTIEILSEYKNIFDIQCIQGENIGAAQSFRELIEICPLGYDVYAFADQDDIWEREKISAAVEEIKHHSQDIPVLWYSGIVHYANGEKGKQSICSYNRATCFETVVDTFSTTNGCTMVFNETLLQSLRSRQLGPIDMHDSFTHAMCLATGGEICVDERPLVRYRIHENQVLGLGSKSFTKQIGRILRPTRLRSATIRVLLSSDFIKDEYVQYLQVLKDYRKLKNKLYIMCKKKPNCMTNREYVKFKIQILLNSF